MLEKTKWAIKNRQSRETGNTGYTRNSTKTKKTENTTQYVLDTTIHKQTQITETRHEPSYKQLEVKTTMPFTYHKLV